MRTLIHCQAIFSCCYVLACDYWDNNGKTSPTSIGGAAKNLVTRVREIWRCLERGEPLSGQQERETGSNKCNSVWLRISNAGSMVGNGCFHRGAGSFSKKKVVPGLGITRLPELPWASQPSRIIYIRDKRFGSTRSVTHLAGSPFHDGIGSTIGSPS